MTTPQILIGHEPRLYREAMAAALRELRPQLAVALVEPDDLEREVARLRPALIVCSALSDAVRRGVPAWVLLYPDGVNLAVIGQGGQERTVPAIKLDQILATIDDATHETASQASAGAGSNEPGAPTGNEPGEIGSFVGRQRAEGGVPSP